MISRRYKTIKLKAALAPLMCILAAGTTSAATLASWDAWDNGVNADFTASGITASLSSDTGFLNTVNTNLGSLDGTYGSTLGGAETVLTRSYSTQSYRGYGVDVADITINITNSTGSSYVLDELLFDYNDSRAYRDYSIVFENVTLSTTSPVLASGSFTTNDWEDANVDASSITLGAGESGRFIISLTYANQADRASAKIDNIAVTAIPEPSAMGFLGLSGMLLLARRRR